MATKKQFVTVENEAKFEVEFNAGEYRIYLGSGLDKMMFDAPDTFGEAPQKATATDGSGRTDETGKIVNPRMNVPVDVWAAFAKRPYPKRQIAARQLRVSLPFSL